MNVERKSLFGKYPTETIASNTTNVDSNKTSAGLSRMSRLPCTISLLPRWKITHDIEKRKPSATIKYICPIDWKISKKYERADYKLFSVAFRQVFLFVPKNCFRILPLSYSIPEKAASEHY